MKVLLIAYSIVVWHTSAYRVGYCRCGASLASSLLEQSNRLVEAQCNVQILHGSAAGALAEVV
jgi:hypothetical protein